MDKPTSQWLMALNAEFRKRNVPAKQRPWLAWSEWAKQTGQQISLNDEIAKEIFWWFQKNTQAGSQYIGPMYTGAFYYDSAFWPVVVPVVFGRAQLKAQDSLKTMPDPMVANMFRDKAELMAYASLWGNCVDYAFAIDHLKKGRRDQFSARLIVSADQKLQAAVALLLTTRPNSTSAESARMSLEMFLKAFLAAKGGLTEEDAKHKLGHNLERALTKCAAVDPKSPLLTIQSSLGSFPEIGARYDGQDQPLAILWKAYEIVQFAGSIVCLALSGRQRTPVRIS